MQQYIVVTAQCPQQPSLICELTKTAASSGCSILHSKMSVLGKEFAAILLLAGSWDAIAKLENSLNTLQSQEEILISVKRSELQTHDEDMLPYLVQVVALEQPAVVQKLCEFFADSQISIAELDSETYTTSGGTNMLSLKIVISIPASLHLATVRENFLLFCDEHNLDSFIEPCKI